MLTNYQRSTLFVLLIGLFLAGCQSYGDGPYSARRDQQIQAALDRMGVAMGEPVDSISSYRIRSWSDINDTSLVINTGLHDHYLVTLATPCLGLPYAFTVALSTTTTQVTSFDDVVVEGLDGYTERCRIQEIYELEHLETEAADT